VGFNQSPYGLSEISKIYFLKSCKKNVVNYAIVPYLTQGQYRFYQAYGSQACADLGCGNFVTSAHPHFQSIEAGKMPALQITLNPFSKLTNDSIGKTNH
jgi:hypothetical protein